MDSGRAIGDADLVEAEFVKLFDIGKGQRQDGRYLIGEYNVIVGQTGDGNIAFRMAWASS